MCDEPRDDIWDHVAPYVNNSMALMTLNDFSRSAAERCVRKGDPFLGVRREIINLVTEPLLPATFTGGSSSAQPPPVVNADNNKRKEEIVYVETTDYERLFRMMWWFQKTEVAVHLYTDKKWIRQEKRLQPLVERSIPAMKSNYHVVWTMLDGLCKGGFAALRLSFNRQLESNDEDYVKPPLPE